MGYLICILHSPFANLARVWCLLANFAENAKQLGSLVDKSGISV